ncbi:unnamed protein product [Brugia pahangi]|uniref:CRAL-TRIO domain-containing protein n=1 Tax=Brugia pahangi TaxID=6280 RepID=A0A0N4T8J3_BRUPA|nr:unnamed protein product [Brugia pahangi]
MSNIIGCHKPVIPVVTFLIPLARNLLKKFKRIDRPRFRGHLRYVLTDIPPQSNSPPDTVFGVSR